MELLCVMKFNSNKNQFEIVILKRIFQRKKAFEYHKCSICVEYLIGKGSLSVDAFDENFYIFMGSFTSFKNYRANVNFFRNNVEQFRSKTKVVKLVG